MLPIYSKQANKIKIQTQRTKTHNLKIKVEKKLYRRSAFGALVMNRQSVDILQDKKCNTPELSANVLQ
jgi:hypothetical protein